MNNPPSFTELATAILKILPYATFDEDNYGQLIIYTDLSQESPNDNDPLVPFESEEF